MASLRRLRVSEATKTQDTEIEREESRTPRGSPDRSQVYRVNVSVLLTVVERCFLDGEPHSEVIGRGSVNIRHDQVSVGQEERPECNAKEWMEARVILPHRIALGVLSREIHQCVSTVCGDQWKRDPGRHEPDPSFSGPRA